MMERQVVRKYFSLLQVIFLLIAVDLLFSNQETQETNAYFQAIEYYEEGQYRQALPFFRQALKDDRSFPVHYPQVYMKMAYCLFKIGRYDQAVTAFESDSARLKLLEDYNDFFITKSILAKGDTAGAIARLNQFKVQYPRSPLTIPADSILANLYFAKKSWSKALAFQRQLLKYRGFDRGEIYGRIIQIALETRDRKLLKDNAFELIRKYPFHPRSKTAYRELDRLYTKYLYPQSKLISVFDYLTDTKQFNEVKRVFERQISLGGETRLIRWLRVRKMYLEKRYWETLQACQEQRSSFKGTRYVRDVDLHIARCYLRLGNVEKAIDAYDTFQKIYPSDRLSPEVIWVIAWLCEKQNQIDRARGYYKRLIVQYPKYQFVSEAKFRIGLSYYRESEFDLARLHWSSVLDESPAPSWRSRYKYWIAKAYSKENEFAAYLKELKDISGRPFDNYYNMKAFLLTKDGIQIRQFVDSLLWEVHHKQVSYIPQYLDFFRRPLLVQDIFGSKYAKNELNELSRQTGKPDWEMTFALGEVNERLQNFGRAYRLYRRVFDENFSNKDWQEWVFLFEYLYPLYFNGEVNQYARQWNITPASIWAIIKKESAFEAQITSYANAYGLMQIIPPTADRLSESLGLHLDDMRRLFNPNFNIYLGSYYLSELLKRYEGNLYYALAAYNAGEHRVDRWRETLNTEDDDFFMENIEFEQTRGYVRGVMKFYWAYHLLIHPYKVPEDLVPFPEKVAREPWFPTPDR
jgi:soluble lytic murein transglycosylase